MSTASLTHAEACALVEKSLEHAINTLRYIRGKLEIPLKNGEERQLSLFEQNFCEEQVKLLCNINWYGAYLAGAKAMYRALESKGYLAVPANKGSGVTRRANDLIINKAQLKLYMSSSRNIEWLLTDVPIKITIRTNLIRNNKGKVVGAESKFYRKTALYEEV